MEADLNVHMRVVLRQVGSLELQSINRACNTEFLLSYILSLCHFQQFRDARSFPSLGVIQLADLEGSTEDPAQISSFSCSFLQVNGQIPVRRPSKSWHPFTPIDIWKYWTVPPDLYFRKNGA